MADFTAKIKQVNFLLDVLKWREPLKQETCVAAGANWYLMFAHSGSMPLMWLLKARRLLEPYFSNLKRYPVHIIDFDSGWLQKKECFSSFLIVWTNRMNWANRNLSAAQNPGRALLKTSQRREWSWMLVLIPHLKKYKLMVELCKRLSDLFLPRRKSAGLGWATNILFFGKRCERLIQRKTSLSSVWFVVVVVESRWRKEFFKPHDKI